MNREQKIALIIGFAVILVVGVLVSDHWSQARRAELADATEGVGDVVQAQPVSVLAMPGTSSPATFAMNQAPAIREPAEQDPAAPDPTPPSAEEPRDVLNIHQGGANSTTLAEAMDRAGTKPDAGKNWLDNFTRLTEQIGGRTGLPQAAMLEATSGKRDGGAAAPSGAGDPRPVAVEPPAAVRYTVQKNESLFGIAKKYYGDGSQWRRIAEANPGLVKSDGGIEPGMTLTIPGVGPKNAASGVKALPGGQPESKPDTKPAASPERKTAPKETRVADGGKPVQYTVQKNDTLGKIAQRFLGSSKRAGDIVAANRGRISDPDDIRAGMVLSIPAK